MVVTPMRLLLPCQPESVGCARRWLADTYSAALDPDVLHTVTLVVSELVTNALRYSAAGTVDVVVELDAGTITVTVFDGGSTNSRPKLRAAGFTAETGRGLRIVDALADEWGVRDLPDGRRAVWVTVKL
jgi:anti-sigma regulatory factor (Ser/Thr protein kinase)